MNTIVFYSVLSGRTLRCVSVVVTAQNRNTSREAVVNNTADCTNSRLEELARMQKFLFGHPIHGKKKKKGCGIQQALKMITCFPL